MEDRKAQFDRNFERLLKLADKRIFPKEPLTLRETIEKVTELNKFVDIFRKGQIS